MKGDLCHPDLIKNMCSGFTSLCLRTFKRDGPLLLSNSAFQKPLMLGFGFLGFCIANIRSPYKCLPNATTSLMFPYPFYPCSRVWQSPRTTPMFLLGKSPWRHQCLRYPCRTWWWRQELTCYSSVSSPPTPHPKVSCRESWRLAGCGEENMVMGTG